MSITVKETRRSRSRTLDTEEREYMAWGSDDPDAVEAAIYAVAPTSIGGLIPTGYRQDPHDEDERVFDATVSYGKYEPKTPAETNSEELSFDLSMVTQHITIGLERVSSYGTNPPDLPGIGFNGDKYEGTDIQVPVFSFRITKYVPIATATSTAYINNLMTCAANPINDALFRGFAAGEVMYVGTAGSQRSNTDFSLTHAFAASPNLTGLSVGDITSIAKKGWEYLWALYEKNEDTTNKFVIEVPKAVYVDRIYNSSSFTTLLGVSA